MTKPEEGPAKADRHGDAAAQLEPRVQEKLGRMLQQHYDDLVAAPVPDQFLVLLAELEAKEKSLGE